MYIDPNLSIREIRVELSRINFDKRAIDTLSNYILKVIEIITSKNLTQNAVNLIEELKYLNSIFTTFNEYREEQQKIVFISIQDDFLNILDSVEAI
jgi:hypothetical protein